MCDGSDAQEPFEFDFWHWLGLGQRENNKTTMMILR